MSYAARKRFAALIAWPLLLACAAIFAAAVRAWLLGRDNGTVALFVGLTGAVIYLTWRHEHQQLHRFQTYDYLWYRGEFPELVRGNRIACYRCHSDQVTVRQLMNRTYTRQHFCAQCGTTLYYSPEHG